MESLRIDILNPKAKNLLLDLAYLKLIRIKKEKIKSEFAIILSKLRNNSGNTPSFDDISKEVESVRKARFEK